MAAEQSTSTGDNYVVVARRYRPKGFEELVGQDTVAQALAAAIRSGRVGHAYLFTGARGVGKTSTARIFAKALNAPGGPTPNPDLSSDVAQAIDAGEDMDVIEIDGASNRGIDEIRQLRSNVNVRPSRSRYKIYIIDEVHMLTSQAFNALLKTLEEPPEHVKFIFCTTDPEKIPITVLSRCQRFDFPPVRSEAILDRLKFICKSEGKEADEAALRVIARRASGSMRDSQSLLEQILSFAGDKLTLQAVHDVLGTADEELLANISNCLLNRDAKSVLSLLESATSHGVDAGQLGEQVLGYLRDVMVACVGGSQDLIRTANPSSFSALETLGKQWGLMTLLSAIQILDEALVKMRHSIQSRILLEVALVQICQLHDLTRISELIAALDTGVASKAPASAAGAGSVSVDEKKNLTLPDATSIAATESMSSSTDSKANAIVSSDLNRPTFAESSETTASSIPQANASPTIDSADMASKPTDGSHVPLASTPSADLGVSSQDNSGIESLATESDERVGSEASETTQTEAGHTGDRSLHQQIDPNQAWQQALQSLDNLVRDYAAIALRVQVTRTGEWQLIFPIGSDPFINILNSGDNRELLVKAVKSVVGQEVNLTFVRSNEPPRLNPLAMSSEPQKSQAQLKREFAEHPLIRKLIDTFEGHIERVDSPASSSPQRPVIADTKAVRSN